MLKADRAREMLSKFGHVESVTLIKVNGSNYFRAVLDRGAHRVVEFASVAGKRVPYDTYADLWRREGQGALFGKKPQAAREFMHERTLEGI